MGQTPEGTSTLRIEKGFTLVEILVVLVLSAIVAVTVYHAFSAQQATYLIQSQVSEMEQQLNGALDIMEREIRTAGYDPAGCSGAGFDNASVHTLQFKADYNGDGDFANQSPPPVHDSNEQIRYALTSDADGNGVADSFPCNLGREVWDGGLQPVAENIEVLNLVYLDRDGSVIPTPVAPADLSKIRSVQVTLIARASRQDKSYKGTPRYRSLQDTLVFAAPGDGYRRRMLTTTVCCRNLGP